MRSGLLMLLGVAGVAFAAQAGAQVTFYEDEDLHGRYLTAEGAVRDFYPYGLADLAKSATVVGGSWEACEDPDFGGHCVVLQPGSYPTLASMGMDRRVSSVRPVKSAVVGYEPGSLAQPYVRPGSTIYQARVTSVRAVLGAAGEQCWVERKQIGPLELPGAIVGGTVDLLSGRQSTDFIQHCTTVPEGARPAYWDVTYEFRGIEHRVQLAAPPGPTIAVNGNGEPRV